MTLEQHIEALNAKITGITDYRKVESILFDYILENNLKLALLNIVPSGFKFERNKPDPQGGIYRATSKD